MLQMQLKNRLKTTCLLASLWLVIMLFLSFIFSAHAQAQGAGVGVLNVPPEYRLTQIVRNAGALEIRLIVTDYNSWQDIQQVRVEIRDKKDLTAIFIYRQYEDEESRIRIDEFRNLLGSALILERCKVERSNSTKTVSDRCSLNLTFAFRPVIGDSVSVSVTDRAREEATTFVEYRESLPGVPGSLVIPGISMPFHTTPEAVHIFIIAFSVSVITPIIAWRLLGK